MRRLWLVLLLLLGLPAAAEEGASRPTVIVVDSSGSMAAALEGATRLDAARDVLARLLADWPAAAPVALVAYGHRRTGDCGDIEVIAPLGPPDPPALVRRLQDLRARGKTPLTAALQEAAALLPPTAEPGAGGSIILLTDGLETCNADPCAVARALHESAARLTVQVVGFGVTSEEAAQLACIAEAGGGDYRSAGDAAELLDTLGAMAEVAVAPPAPAPLPAPAPAPAPEPVAEPEPPPVVPQPVGFVAVYAGGEQPLDLPVAWEVTALGDTPALDYAGGGRGLSLTLPPGRYRATLRAANATAAQEFEVAAEPLQVAVPIAVGHLEASVVPARGQPPLGAQDAPAWTLEPLEGQPAPEQIGGARPALLLAAGRYRLGVTKDLWSTTGEVAIRSGETAAVELSLALGGLTLEAALDDAAPPLVAWQGLKWQVLDAAGQLLLSRDSEAQPRFLLPAGDYRVALSLGSGAASAGFTVAEGEERRGRVIVPAGTVTLTAALAPTADLLTDWRDTAWSVTAVEALGQNPGDAAMSGYPVNNPEVTLTPGRWLVSVQSGLASAEREVEVAPGGATTLRLDLQAARLEMLALPPAGAAEAANVVYEVAPLAADGTAGPLLALGGSSGGIGSILPAGGWLVVATDSLNRRDQRRIVLAPGAEESLTLELR